MSLDSLQLGSDHPKLLLPLALQDGCFCSVYEVGWCPFCLIQKWEGWWHCGLLIIGLDLPIGVLCQPALCAFALPETALEKKWLCVIDNNQTSYFLTLSPVWEYTVRLQEKNPWNCVYFMWKLHFKRADNKLVVNKLMGMDLLSEETYFSDLGRQEVYFLFSSRTSI